MAYRFLNESFSNFIAPSIGGGGFMFARTPDYNAFRNNFPLELSETTQEILSHDFETFSKMLSFLNSGLNTFILHGFMGSGKSAMINLLEEITDETVLYFRINCFDSTNLDDVLLALHNRFVYYHNEKKIILPKTESNGFAERINAYIKNGNRPMLFVFDSLDSERCPLHGEIINFIKHIAQIDKIKVVITSRNLAANDLPNDSSTNFAVIKLYGKEEFIKLLNNHGIESDEETYENVFLASKGHYLYISLIINVINLLNISLKSLYNDFSKKNMIIFDFLISKMLKLIPERCFKTLWFLALIRSGVSEDFLIAQKLATKDIIEYLEERMLLCKEGTNIYLKDYVKGTVEELIDKQTLKDIHKYLYELYEAQLPKKPSERDLVISRSTMRREAAYHKEISETTNVESEQQTIAKNNLDYNYLSYSNSTKKDWTFGTQSSDSQKFSKPLPRGLETRIKNNLKAKQFELSNEELNLLNQLNMKVPNAEFINPAKKLASAEKETTVPQNRYVEKTTNTTKENTVINTPTHEEKPVPETETLATVMQKAALAEQDFNYEKALSIYGKAYNMTEEAGYTEAKPIIMMQTAYCHRKMQNNEEALRSFEIAYRLYDTVNPQKANVALFNMAEIYTETYNHAQAKAMYEKILLSKSNNDLSFKARVLLNLADIENNSANSGKSHEYYNEAINTATQIDDKKLICECCFKYGLMCDDEGDVDKAFKLYLRCIQTSADAETNAYLSSAYGNIAEIYEEQNYTDKAVKYYEESAKADEQTENFEGAYFSYSKISTLLQSKSITQAIEYSKKSLNSAKQINDYLYIASAYIQLGDCYYQSNKSREALKSYLYAKSNIVKQPNTENIRKVDVRINNMRAKLGETIFNDIVAEVGNN